MTSTRTVRVSTRDYEFAHGRTPRGFGHWAFEFGEREAAEAVEFWTGTYSEAKAQAVRFAKDNGYSYVSVGS